VLETQKTAKKMRGYVRMLPQIGPAEAKCCKWKAATVNGAECVVSEAGYAMKKGGKQRS
jgi:hypothetical protein